MTDKDLKPQERIVVEAMREHDAHGFGDMRVKTTPEFVEIHAGKITRVKKCLDKNPRTG